MALPAGACHPATRTHARSQSSLACGSIQKLWKTLLKQLPSAVTVVSEHKNARPLCPMGLFGGPSRFPTGLHREFTLLHEFIPDKLPSDARKPCLDPMTQISVKEHGLLCRRKVDSVTLALSEFCPKLGQLRQSGPSSSANACAFTARRLIRQCTSPACRL